MEEKKNEPFVFDDGENEIPDSENTSEIRNAGEYNKENTSKKGANECKCGEHADAEKHEECDKHDGHCEHDEKDDKKSGSKKLKAENKKLSDSLSELDERYKRTLAEYDNFRKRAAKERESAYSDAYADALKEILSIKDSLEMALKYPDSEKVVQGVNMTLNKFKETMNKLGVEEFGEAGESFDPNIHNAVMHIEDEEYKENEIVEVLMKGYKKGDKIIRYAMVKVAN